MKSLKIILISVLLCSPIKAQRNHYTGFYSSQNKTMIGVLKSLKPGTSDGSPGSGDMMPLKVFDRPEKESTLKVQLNLSVYGLTNSGKFPARIIEFDYGVRGLTVFDKKGDWVQVELVNPKASYGWIKLGEGIQFVSLSKLIEGRGGGHYLTQEWDQLIYADANLSVPLKLDSFFKAEVMGLVEIPRRRQQTDSYPPKGSRGNQFPQIGLYKKPDDSADVYMSIARSNAGAWVANIESIDKESKDFPFIYKIPVLEIKDKKWLRVALSPNFKTMLRQTKGLFVGKPIVWKGLLTVWINREQVNPIQFFSKPQKKSELYSKAVSALFGQNVPAKYEVKDIKIHRLKQVKGRWVANIDLISGYCSDQVIKLGTGWVALKSLKEQVNIWFYSRGC